MRARGCIALALVAGCSTPTTTRLAVDVGIATGVMPTTVTVSVFDAHGQVGHAAVSPAPLPGQLMVTGLPDTAVDLRIAAVGTGGTQVVLGATRVTLVPHMLTTASLTLAYGTLDADNDGVPDVIDDCPTVPDPLQTNSAGTGPGDACRNGALPSGDLAGADLRATTPVDLAGPMPDLMRVASTCATAGVAFCDGFETATLAPHWIVTNNMGGSAVVDPTRAYRGAASLHLHNDAIAAGGSSDVELDETQTFAAYLYARAFIYVPSSFDAAEADVLLVEQNASPYQGITLGMSKGVFMTQDTLAGGTALVSTTTVPKDRWTCVEWEVRLGSAGSSNGTTTLTVDGTAASGLGAAQPLYATPPINQLGIGLVGGGSAAIPARDLWIDELIVDTAPIGCAR